MASQDNAVVPEKVEATHQAEAPLETKTSADGKHEIRLVERDNEQEHSLTLGYVARHHPKILWWSFFWCMCAVGWGFDTQVNGAIISVPAFREYYG